jgi:hypothetical protein
MTANNEAKKMIKEPMNSRRIANHLKIKQNEGRDIRLCGIGRNI